MNKLPHLYFCAATLFIGACSPVSTTDTQAKLVSNSLEAAQKNFKATPAEWIGNKVLGHVSFNGKITEHYQWSQQLPALPVLVDDHQDRSLHFALTFLSAEFGPSFVKVLPSRIQTSLKEKTIKAEDIKVAFIVQGSGNIGEDKDFEGVPTQTHLMAHAWADPDAPRVYSGSRVNRNFLLGIFEPEQNITTKEMGTNQLIETPIFVHDHYFSPHTSTSIVKLHKHSPSQSFWSVTIDPNNPDEKKRALVCLHWILNSYDDEWRPMLRAFMSIVTQPKTIGAPAVENFGEFLEKINKSSEFKDTQMLERLNSLFK